MTPAEVLTFNSFISWILAGIATKLVLGKQQYLKRVYIMNHLNEESVSEYEANKLLSMKRISHWEQMIFIPCSSQLLSSHGHKYIIDAIKSTHDPVSLHFKLIISASEMLYRCLSDNTLSLGITTVTQINLWFDFVTKLENGPLWRLLGPRDHRKILYIIENYHELGEYPTGDTEFRHFSTRSLILTHAFVVNLQYGHPSNISTKLDQNYVGKHIKVPNEKEENMEDNSEDDEDYEYDEMEGEYEVNEDKPYEEDEYDADDDYEYDEKETDDVNETEEKENENCKDNMEDISEDDENDDEEQEHPMVDKATLSTRMDSDEETTGTLQYNVTEWIKILSDWSSATFSFVSPMFQIEAWRNARYEQPFPYLGMKVFHHCSEAPFNRCKTLHPHEVFQMIMELIIARYQMYQYMLGPAPSSNATLHIKILTETQEQIKRVTKELNKKFVDQEKNARHSILHKKYKSVRTPVFDYDIFLFGDLFSNSFSQLFFTMEEVAGAY